MRVAPVGGRFLDACRRRNTDVRPVWFMRQAGRYLKQYRDIRAKHSILEFCKKPELAAAVTLQPIEILDVDAAIIFADLLLPVEPMGLKLEFVSGEGPYIENAVTEPEDIDDLSTTRTDDLGYVGEAIRHVTRALGGRIPVIGFVGAPFTLASYLIEGGASRTFVKTKRLMFGNEIMWRRLMGKLVDVLGDFARLQIGSGARAVQVFDSWVGALSPEDYVRYVQPYSRALIERIRAGGVPVIHFGTGASGFFRELHAAGGDVLGVDWRINIDHAWMEIGYRSAIQGNLDPVALFAPLPELRTKVTDLLRRTGTRPGHIVNLGHGVLPETPVESLKTVIRIVRDFPASRQCVQKM
jgi:uroporphyrinogen decarboxylase